MHGVRHVGTQPQETRRLLLRRFTVQDAEAMYQNWATDAEVTRWMRWEPHANVEVTKGWLREWEQNYARDAYYHWAIVRKSDGALIGSIGILPTDGPETPVGFSLGYCFGRAFWGNGYATEALQAVVRTFFENTGIKTLVCCHAQANPASGRVMQKAGFRYTHNGVYYKQNGQEVPAKYYICHAGSVYGRNEKTD